MLEGIDRKAKHAPVACCTMHLTCSNYAYAATRFSFLFDEIVFHLFIITDVSQDMPTLGLPTVDLSH